MTANEKGFIGPLGDDLPSLIAIMMALSLFFAGLTYSLDAFNEKQSQIQAMKASASIARLILQRGVFPDQASDISLEEARDIADANNMGVEVGYDSTPDSCGENSRVRSYLVPKQGDSSGLELDTLYICTWRKIS